MRFAKNYDIFDINNVLELNEISQKHDKAQFISDMTQIPLNIIIHILVKFQDKIIEVKNLLNDIKAHNVKFPLISSIGATS